MKRSDICLTAHAIFIGILSALDKYLIFVASYPIDASLPPDISIGMLRHHLRCHRSIEAWMPLCRDLRPFGSQIIETYEDFSSRAIWALAVA